MKNVYSIYKYVGAKQAIAYDLLISLARSPITKMAIGEHQQYRMRRYFENMGDELVLNQQMNMISGLLGLEKVAVKGSNE